MLASLALSSEPARRMSTIDETPAVGSLIAGKYEIEGASYTLDDSAQKHFKPECFQ